MRLQHTNLRILELEAHEEWAEIPQLSDRGVWLSMAFAWGQLPHTFVNSVRDLMEPSTMNHWSLTCHDG